MKRELVSLLLIVLFFMTTTLQAQNSEVVYLRIVESTTANIDNYIQISGSDGTGKRIELEKVKIKGEGAENNGIIISKQVKILIDQGYELKSHSTAGMEWTITTMIFIKKEN